MGGVSSSLPPMSQRVTMRSLLQAPAPSLTMGVNFNLLPGEFIAYADLSGAMDKLVAQGQMDLQFMPKDAMSRISRIELSQEDYRSIRDGWA